MIGGRTQYSVLTPIRSSLITHHQFLNADPALADSDFKKCAPGTGSALQYLRRKPGLLTSFHSEIRIVDLPNSQDIRIEVTVETRGNFDGYISEGHSNIRFSASPTARRNTQSEPSYCYRRG